LRMRALEVVAKKPRVLVVDDFDDVREMYVDYLRYLGFDADGAANGREAVRKTLAHRQSLVVMDLAMPVLDGWEATRILRADRRTRDIPIVVLTGHALPEHVKRAKDAGANEVVEKPCEPAALGRIVVQTLAAARKL
jgi:two-component system, cell cycle response regulator DivK